MSLRKLSTLLAMLSLVFVVMVGCSNVGDEAHLPPNIGTNPATGGVDPVSGAGSGTQSVLGTNAPPTPTPVVVADVVGQLFSNGANGRKVFLGCSGDTAADGTPIPNYNCSDFISQAQAKNFKLRVDALRPGRIDCHGLDGNIGRQDDDGSVCTGLPLN